MAESESKLSRGDELNEVEARKRKLHLWRAVGLMWCGFMFPAMTLLQWYDSGYVRIPPLRPLLWSTIPSLISAGFFWGLLVWTHRRSPDL
jgi:hypothetical protein